MNRLCDYIAEICTDYYPNLNPYYPHSDRYLKPILTKSEEALPLQGRVSLTTDEPQFQFDREISA